MKKIKSSAAMRLLFRAALVLAAGAPAARSQTQPAPAQPQHVRLVSFMVEGDPSLLPYLVAREKGFFSDNGLSVDISFEASPNPPEAIMEADYFSKGDVYQMLSGAVYQIESKKPGLLKVFDFDYQDAALWNDALLVRKDSGISSLKDLDPNKPIGILNGGLLCDPLLRQMITKAGLAPEPLRFIYSLDYQGMVDDGADSGRMELVYAREPNYSMLLRGGDWKVLAEGPLFAKNILSPWFMSMSCFSSEFLSREPALAQKLLVSYRQAIDFITKHPQEARDILARDFLKISGGTQPLPLRLVHHALSDDIDPGTAQKQSDWFLENHLSSAKIDAARLLYRVHGAVKPQP